MKFIKKTFTNRTEVRTRRFELPHSKRILAPQASASTNSATCACMLSVKIKKVKHFSLTLE